MKIIAATGYKQSGKDTTLGLVEDYLYNNYPHVEVMKISFAEHMKEMVHQIFRWPDSYIFNPPDGWKDTVIESLGFAPRQAYEQFATNFMRNLDEDFWIRRVDEVTKTVSNDAIVLITDVRFPNEYNWVKQNGGIIVKVNRYDVAPDVIYDESGNCFVVDNNGKTVPEPESYVHTFVEDITVYNNDASIGQLPDVEALLQIVDSLCESFT